MHRDVRTRSMAAVFAHGLENRVRVDQWGGLLARSAARARYAPVPHYDAGVPAKLALVSWSDQRSLLWSFHLRNKEKSGRCVLLV